MSLRLQCNLQRRGDGQPCGIHRSTILAGAAGGYVLSGGYAHHAARPVALDVVPLDPAAWAQGGEINGTLCPARTTVYPPITAKRAKRRA